MSWTQRDSLSLYLVIEPCCIGRCGGEQRGGSRPRLALVAHSVYDKRVFSISPSGTDSTERGKGFDLRMSEFIVSTSIFYDGDTLSLALAAVFDFQLDKRLLGSWRDLLLEQDGYTSFLVVD